MTVSETSSDSQGTAPDDYDNGYYDSYAGHGDYDWDDDTWREFFLQAAVRVKALTNASNSLDVGCAKGLFVQAMAVAGIDSAGIDFSEDAIASAHVDVRDRLRVASATDAIKGRYDLISCIEVLEHLSPTSAQLAIDNICAATDLILMSSTPGHFDEPTHVNVRPTAEWAAWFAERGFFRRVDVNLDFLAPWAVLFQRTDLLPRDLVHRYESQYATLHGEVIEKRAALLAAHHELARLTAAGPGATADVERLQDEVVAHRTSVHEMKQQLVEAQLDVLTRRDHVIGLEAMAEESARKAVQIQGRLKAARAKADELEKRLVRQRRRADENQRKLDETLGSRSWRVGRLLARPFRGR